MEKSSSGRNETNQKLFDSYCKRILKNEAIDCLREIQKHRQREIFFSELSEKEWKQLYMEDEYDLDTCNFQVLGYDVEVKDALIAEALNLLSDKKREVVLLAYFLDMSDTEIAKLLNLRQSTIHYHRTSSLKSLKEFLEERTNED
ncbi:MAG: sigma-70 family RNA polymerase sigma factor [Ruminococcaceae bacterium]|nr:sigma-70 family RNA polymerase sigma factor [Oscillospiraceae bacterium]